VYQNEIIMKNKLELIEQLEQVQYNIELVEKQVNEKVEDTAYYRIFYESHKKFEHNKAIRIKALAYWKRRFNRILNDLYYMNTYDSDRCSLCGGKEYRTTKMYKPAKKCSECRRVTLLDNNKKNKTL